MDILFFTRGFSQIPQKGLTMPHAYCPRDGTDLMYMRCGDAGRELVAQPMPDDRTYVLPVPLLTALWAQDRNPTEYRYRTSGSHPDGVVR